MGTLPLKESHTDRDPHVSATLPYSALRTIKSDDLTLVLLDPDDYLANELYLTRRKAGAPALRNLWAFNAQGIKIWEAELPEDNDYYFAIEDASAPTARSYSGFTCVLDMNDGTIVSKVFNK